MLVKEKSKPRSNGLGGVTLYLDTVMIKTFRKECLKRNVSASELIRGFMDKKLSDWKVKEDAA